jgi:hypothetical protein
MVKICQTQKMKMVEILQAVAEETGKPVEFVNFESFKY